MMNRCKLLFVIFSIRHNHAVAQHDNTLGMLGNVVEADARRIGAHRILNNVAASLFVKAMAAEHAGRYQEAREAYQKLLEFSYARVWDPSYGGYPQPLAYHPLHEQHPFEKFGCTICHRGQGRATTTADASGAYQVSGLAPGSYIVHATFAGFAPFEMPAIQLAAGQVKRVDISMAVEAEQQSVVVTDESQAVNVEAGSNASSLVLKDKDLDAFSDDPDELSNELTALAGPSAGPNGR